MRLYSPDPPDDPCDRPDDWEGELPCEVVSHADLAFAQWLVSLDECGAGECEPIDGLDEPFGMAAE